MTEFAYYLNNHILMFLLSISMLILLVFTSRINKKNKRLLFFIVFSTVLLAIFECLETLFTNDYIHEENFPRYLFSSFSYILRPIIIVLFYHIRFDFKNKKYLLVWVGVIINTIIYALALFGYHNPNMQFVFWYSQDNLFMRGWLGFAVFVISGFYALFLIVTSIVEFTIYKKKRQIDFIIIFTAAVAIALQIVTIIFELKTSYTSEIFGMGAILYFIYLNYDKSTKEAIEHERENQANTTALMLSQIQPQFIHNTLTAIQILYESDQKKASKTLDSFNKYLKMNTEALSKTMPVSIKDEINHARAYSDIQMIMHDNINVSFIIKDVDFKLPVLTIEPILENAIKYGVMVREKGKIQIVTYKDGKNHILIIKDNGVGFNLERVKNDKKKHIGIENVRTRIINMSHGTFDIESILNKGTKVIITIPDEE